MLAVSKHLTFISILRTLFGLSEKTRPHPGPQKTWAAQPPAVPGPDALSDSPVARPEAQERRWPVTQLEAKLDLYESHDPLPVPQMSEHSGDELWSAFKNLQQSTHPILPSDGGHGSAHFAATVPACAAMLIPMNHQAAVFAATARASMIESPEISSSSTQTRYPAQPAIKVEDVIAIARHRNRACPKPKAWSRICADLGRASLLADGCAPPAPISSAEWSRTTFLAKRTAFRKVIDWSVAVGCLPVLQQLMLEMPESDWQYID
jgi:hypothetical protein